MNIESMIPTCFLYKDKPEELTPLLPQFEMTGQCQIHSRSKEVFRGKVLTVVNHEEQHELVITFEWICSRGFAKKNIEVTNAKWKLHPDSLEGKPYIFKFTYKKFYEQRKDGKLMGRVKIKGTRESCRFYLSDDSANIDIARIVHEHE